MTGVAPQETTAGQNYGKVKALVSLFEENSKVLKSMSSASNDLSS